MNGCQKHGPNNAAETSKTKTIWEWIYIVGRAEGEKRSDPADIEVVRAPLRSETMIGSQRSSYSQRYPVAVGLQAVDRFSRGLRNGDQDICALEPAGSCRRNCTTNMCWTRSRTLPKIEKGCRFPSCRFLEVSGTGGTPSGEVQNPIYIA